MLAGHRFSVFCQGDTDLIRQQIRSGLAQHPALSCLWLSATAVKEQGIIAQSQANQYLGQETDVLVFDASKICRPDALAASLGTLRGGGLFFMLLPETPESLWLKRFINLSGAFASDSQQAIFWHTSQSRPEINWPQPYQDGDFSLTADQHKALQAIDKVVTGHRRRPLLITADRGRGKSALLGIAAAQYSRQGKSSILVTAPSKANVATLFQHAADAEHKNTASQAIRFVAPDALLQNLPEADLLLVDEAAALPQPLLQQLLSHYSRIVFASTLHGYEGSGFGFKHQFAKLLDKQAPGWQQITLSAPVRWSADDPLETFSYQALLLDADLSASAAQLSDSTGLVLEQLSSVLLADDATLLHEVFALLVSAHYRTRPSDVQALLDDNSRTLWTLTDGKTLAAICWLSQENPLAEDLAAAVHQGRRRLKGQLLPQSLLAHAGNLAAAACRYQRIIRIAVRPDLQRQGLGSALLQKLIKQLPADTDVVGCSFAMQTDIFRFWQQNGFVPVRLGLHEDTVSAGRAVVMLKACSEKGAAQITALQQRLAEQWPVLLPRYFADLPAETVLAVSDSLPIVKPELSADDRIDIDSFVFAQRALEFSFVPLNKLLWQQLNADAFKQMEPVQQAILIQILLQQQPLPQVCQQHALDGHKALLATLRMALIRLLTD